MARALSEDPLTATLYQFHIDKKGCKGFSTVIASPGLDLLEEIKTDDITCDWHVHDNSTLPTLERRIQDIIRIILACEIPDDWIEPTLSSLSSAMINPEPNLFRLLANDFLSLPLGIPNYSDYVKRLISLESITQSLQKHHYKSMASFEKDFIEMLNNGRSVTLEGSQTWIDSNLLATLFQQLKVLSLSPIPRSISHHPLATISNNAPGNNLLQPLGTILNLNGLNFRFQPLKGLGGVTDGLTLIRQSSDDTAVDPDSSSPPSSSSTSSFLPSSLPSSPNHLQCGGCNVPYVIYGWPKKSDQSKDKRSHKQKPPQGEGRIKYEEIYEINEKHNFEYSVVTKEIEKEKKKESGDFFWVVDQILEDGSVAFAYPKTYVLNNR
jgi:hypothetical protein